MGRWKVTIAPLWAPDSVQSAQPSGKRWRLLYNGCWWCWSTPTGVIDSFSICLFVRRSSASQLGQGRGFMLKWIDLKCRNHPASLEHVQTRNGPSLRLITQVEHHTAASQVPPGTKVSPCWFFFFSWKYENCRDKRKWWAWDGHCLQHFGGRSCNSF